MVQAAATGAIQAANENKKCIVVRELTWQEWQDSNLQPPVLETGALAIELHSCGSGGRTIIGRPPSVIPERKVPVQAGSRHCRRSRPGRGICRFRKPCTPKASSFSKPPLPTSMPSIGPARLRSARNPQSFAFDPGALGRTRKVPHGSQAGHCVLQNRPRAKKERSLERS